jgi:hypothetical protein
MGLANAKFPRARKDRASSLPVTSQHEFVSSHASYNTASRCLERKGCTCLKLAQDTPSLRSFTSALHIRRVRGREGVCGVMRASE